jgi:hypothetical protein
LVFVLGHLRQTTTVAVCGALVIAALFSDGRARAVRLVGAIAIAALVPWYLGIGPAGIDLVRPLGEVRSELACGAKSKVVKCDSGTESESVSVGSLSDATAGADLAHLPRGLSVMLLEPFPWSRVGGFQARLAQIFTPVFWLPLLVLAFFGIPSAYRHRRELSFLFLTAGALLVIYALGEGNLGTAFRHRSELVPALAVLAAFGGPQVMARWRRRSLSAARRAGGSGTHPLDPPAHDEPTRER